MFMFYRKWRNEICYGLIACASKESFQDDLRILLKLLEEDKLSRPGEVHLFNDLFPRFLRQRFDVVKFCQKELERIS